MKKAVCGMGHSDGSCISRQQLFYGAIYVKCGIMYEKCGISELCDGLMYAEMQLDRYYDERMVQREKFFNCGMEVTCNGG